MRGLNASKKWNSIRDKISESKCDIACLQETKREIFDDMFVRRFCPASLDKFAFHPSVGASGGMITLWKGCLFDGEPVHSNEFALSVKFRSLHNSDEWILSNIYGPCVSEGKRQFLSWFSGIQMPSNLNWLIVGDFNLIRSPENRNKPGGSMKCYSLMQLSVPLGLWKFFYMVENKPGQINNQIRF